MKTPPKLGVQKLTLVYQSKHKTYTKKLKTFLGCLCPPDIPSVAWSNCALAKCQPMLSEAGQLCNSHLSIITYDLKKFLFFSLVGTQNKFHPPTKKQPTKYHKFSWSNLLQLS